jgi:hypothetical protein
MPKEVDTPPPLPEKTEKQTKITAMKKKFSNLFSRFEGFWTPVLGFTTLFAIVIFVSGINDRDIISYSLLIFISMMVLFYSWRILAINTKEEPHGKTHWFLKPFLVIFKFLTATIPQVITVVQLFVIITIFTKYKDLVYDDQKAIPAVFQTFNWGLFAIMLGQIGMMNWYLGKNIDLDKTFFQKAFLPIFVIIGTISTSLIIELYVIIRHFLTDG